MRRREAELAAALAAELTAMRTLRDLLLADPKGTQSGGQAVPPELEIFVEGSDPKSLIPNLPSQLTALAQTYADRRALLAERVRGLREEGERLRREIAQLRTGDRDASYEAEAPAAAGCAACSASSWAWAPMR